MCYYKPVHTLWSHCRRHSDLYLRCMSLAHAYMKRTLKACQWGGVYTSVGAAVFPSFVSFVVSVVDQAEELIKQEMLMLLRHDLVYHLPDSASVSKATVNKMKSELEGKKLESFDEEELQKVLPTSKCPMSTPSPLMSPILNILIPLMSPILNILIPLMSPILNTLSS